jgi:hypothetical protein
MNFPLEEILGKTFALRNKLRNVKFHLSKESIPKEYLTEELEPQLRPLLKNIASQICKNPKSILEDSYTKEERTVDWASLQAKKVLENGTILEIDTRSKPGHKILDHHMKHFWDVKNFKGISVRSLVQQETLEKALLANVSMHSTPYKSEIRKMLITMGGLGNVTKYRTITSKAIVQFFNARTVLDPCIGWGGRMLGTLAASPDSMYIGCEPDPNTYSSLKQILDDDALPKEVRKRAIVLQEPAEIGLERISRMGGKFDLVLTSPPYFNLELYTAGDQSTNQYTSWDDWVNHWLKPIVLKSLSMLKPEGVSCWSVKNFRSDKAYPLADVTKKIHEDAGWKLVKTVVMKGSARMGGKRIINGKEARESEEETFCFRRK